MQRLSSTPAGETLSIGVRLPPPLLELVDREVERLRAGAAEPDKIVRGTAIRALLVELEQRRAADPTSAPAPRLTRAALARIMAAVEGAGAELRGLLEGTPPEDRGDDRVEDEGEGQRARGAAQQRAVHHQVPRPLPVVHAANDGAEAVQRPAKASESPRPANTASASDNAPASPEVLAALKPRLVAAIAAGHSAKAIGRGAGVDAASITRWLSGTRPGVSVGTARKLGEALATLGF